MRSETTCWTLIQAAAAGQPQEREDYANRYGPMVRTYLLARWGNSGLVDEIGDAAQEFFVECFREGGPLDRVERGRAGGFRPFLYGVIRNVALRFEERRAKQRGRSASGLFDFEEVIADEASLSQIFDRAWASSILEEAAERQAKNAKISGPPAMNRVRLLELRFGEGLPIREIAEQWQTDALTLHREYAKARVEF